MRTFTEQRGAYMVPCYEIDVTPLMKKLAFDFSCQIILENNQYDRLMPSSVRDLGTRTRIRIQRTYVGKVAELAFAAFLMEKGADFKTSGMFQVYEGQENADSYDFVNRAGEKIDIKCGFRSIHKLLAVNQQQFESENHKDYYVGVKLNAADIDEVNKLIDLDSVTNAQILGYAEHNYLSENPRVRDLGEGPAVIIGYDHLLGIDRLLESF